MTLNRRPSGDNDWRHTLRIFRSDVYQTPHCLRVIPAMLNGDEHARFRRDNKLGLRIVPLSLDGGWCPLLLQWNVDLNRVRRLIVQAPVRWSSYANVIGDLQL